MLVGDFLFSRAFELMVEDGALSVLSICRAPRRSSPRAGAAARHLEQCRDHRSRLSRSDQRQDGASSSPPQAASAPSSPAATRPRSRRSDLRPQSRHRLPAHRRHARLFGAAIRASATISATARSRCRWCWRCVPPTIASANSGAARSKTASSATAISSMRSN